MAVLSVLDKRKIGLYYETMKYLLLTFDCCVIFKFGVIFFIFMVLHQCYKFDSIIIIFLNAGIEATAP